MHEYLSKNSWTYREWANKRLQQGIEQGRTQGMEAGVRLSIVEVVQTRFPALVALLQERLESIQGQEDLHKLLVAMSAASTEQNARHYLIGLQE